MKNLYIAEKPSVAREFAKALGMKGAATAGARDGYLENEDTIVTWCVGHLITMSYPEVYDPALKKWSFDTIPFIPEEYKYEIIDASSKQFQIVSKLLNREDVGRIYVCTDSGREGEYIYRLVEQMAGVDKSKKDRRRVWIDSQTEEEIMRGIREAKELSAYDNLSDAAYLRAQEDYLMGINFSRALSLKYSYTVRNYLGMDRCVIAVGRVMTCVLGMIVKREREIRQFVPTPFYRVLASTEGFEAEWKTTKDSAYLDSPLLYKENGFKKEESAKQLITELSADAPIELIVQKVEKKTEKKAPPMLYNLAELQNDCSRLFKISPTDTLNTVQTLYERKLVTYPRTDARVLSTAVAKEIGKNIGGLQKYEPLAQYAQYIMQQGGYKGVAKSKYVNDKQITDHYAIVPTGQVNEYKSLTELQKRVYELIVRRFLSIFYPPAQYQTVKLTIGIEKESFFAGAKVLKVPGYLEIAGRPDTKEKREKEDGDGEENNPKNSAALLKLADSLKEGDTAEVKEFLVKEGKTSPPKRYTSGSMVLAMENAGQLIEEEELREQIKGSGIGTSATRAEIIKKLVRIGYLALNKKTQVLTPEALGEMVYEVVNMTVPALLNPKMTASWEKGLDGITQGTVPMEDYREKLEEFIRKETVSMINENLTSQIAGQIRPLAGSNAKDMKAKVKIGATCPVCGGEIETTPFGYGCSNYNKDGSGCRFAIGSIAGRELNDEEVKQLLSEGRTGVLKGFTSKNKKKFSACLVMTKDEEGKPNITFDFSQNEPETIEGVSCPLCGGAIEIKPFGYGCANYKAEDEAGCRFAIGKIAGKDLNTAQVKELLTNGRTGTIRGFTSKNKKKFDACLMLGEDENGKKVLKFDFEHVEAKKVKDVKCPLCQGDIVQTPFGYGCANYDRNKEDSCRFSIGKIAGVKLKETQVKALLLTGKTEIITGFKSKNGKKFDAPLKLTEDGRIEFDFPERPKPEETKVKCPKCGALLKKSQWYYECDCGFRVNRYVAKVELAEEVLEELFTKGYTAKKITGFTSKAGNVFDTCLKFEEDEIRFDFDRKPEEEREEEKDGTVQNQ